MADLKKVGGCTISEEINGDHNVISLKNADGYATATIDSKTGEFCITHKLYKDGGKIRRFKNCNTPFEVLTAAGFDASATHEFLNLVTIRSTSMRSEHQLRSIRPRQ